MLHYNTVNDLLRECLMKLITSQEFASFRLVGGTALSLQLGHRISIDIDLFSDVAYGSIDFIALERYLQSGFGYVDYFSLENPAIGMSFSIGKSRDESIKLDLYYTDLFIQPALIADNIRMATVEEIIAMKIDVVQRGGRKKDFWDLHELFRHYPISKMLNLHKQRYKYAHNKELILKKFTDFSIADDDLEPMCLRGKYWEFIKEDIEDAIKDYQARKSGCDE